DWLKPIEQPYGVVHILYESRLCTRFPVDALVFLNAIIVAQPWAPTELRLCLSQIAEAEPSLIHDQRYQRLQEYLRRAGPV
ncbi:MAG TPA: hypothetical protein VFV43_01465, partial [Limnobacter sp.]|nr:hypothetical protein [Limnobacter sp.]